MNVETPLVKPDAEAAEPAAARPWQAHPWLTWWKGDWSARRIRNLVLGIATVASLCAAFYFLLLASDRYVSQANVVVERTRIAGPSGMNFDGLLSGFVSSGNRADQMLLRDHLLSIDMLKKLDARLHLRAHYSDWHRDPLSRLWFSDTPIERFHDYFMDRVRIDYDDYDGVLELRVEAFDPKTAHAIVVEMLRNGEAFMNETDHKLAQAQIDFLEGEVKRMSARDQRARQALIDFQNREGIVSPENRLRSVEGIINQLEAHKSALQVRMTTLQSYLVPDHPDVVAIRQQMDAIDAQIEAERKKATASGNSALNRKTERFQKLQQEANFTHALLQTTLAALENGKVDAARTVKKISAMQSATMPEAATQPRRLRSTITFALIAFMMAGISLLLISIVRDHFD